MIKIIIKNKSEFEDLDPQKKKSQIKLFKIKEDHLETQIKPQT